MKGRGEEGAQGRSERVGPSQHGVGPCGWLRATEYSPTHSWPLTERGELEAEDGAVLTAHHALLAPEGGLQPLLAIGCAHQNPVLPGAGGQAYYLGAGGRKEPGQGPAWPRRWATVREPTPGADHLPISWLQGPKQATSHLQALVCSSVEWAGPLYLIKLSQRL